MARDMQGRSSSPQANFACSCTKTTYARVKLKVRMCDKQTKKNKIKDNNK